MDGWGGEGEERGGEGGIGCGAVDLGGMGGGLAMDCVLWIVEDFFFFVAWLGRRGWRMEDGGWR